MTFMFLEFSFLAISGGMDRKSEKIRKSSNRGRGGDLRLQSNLPICRRIGHLRQFDLAIRMTLPAVRYIGHLVQQLVCFRFA